MVQGHVTRGDISLNRPKVYRQQEDNQQGRQDKTRQATHDNQSTIQECIKILQIDTEYYMDTAIL
jgi:hypothetical protein